MKLNRFSHFPRAVLTALVLLTFMLCAWLTIQFPVQIDVSAQRNNSLSQASTELLASLPEAITITAYIQAGSPLRLQINDLISKYQQAKPNIAFHFVNPDNEPEKARELELGPEGAVIVEYQGRSEKLKFIDEATLSNALLHLASAKTRWLSFLTGHGERAIDGMANFDYGVFGKQLAARNLKSVAIHLTQLPDIPDNSGLLVLAAPSAHLLAGELEMLRRYIDKGGNLLLLLEHDTPQLEGLLMQLGLSQLPGIMLEAKAKKFGLDNHEFVPVSQYPSHPITRGLQIITLFPVVSPLTHNPNSVFDAKAILRTDTGILSETGDNKEQTVSFGWALTRSLANDKEQRIVVIGDSDFLSNAYLGNVANLDFGLRVVNWLLHDDNYLDVPNKSAQDKQLRLNPLTVAIVGFGFLLILPLALVSTGLVISWRRKRR